MPYKSPRDRHTVPNLGGDVTYARTRALSPLTSGNSSEIGHRQERSKRARTYFAGFSSTLICFSGQARDSARWSGTVGARAGVDYDCVSPPPPITTCDLFTEPKNGPFGFLTCERNYPCFPPNWKPKSLALAYISFLSVTHTCRNDESAVLPELAFAEETARHWKLPGYLASIGWKVRWLAMWRN